MKQVIFLVFIIPFLISCYVRDGCIVSPQNVSCFGESKEIEAIALYQKKDSIGHTDPKQRWIDVVACGAQYGDLTLSKNIRDEKGFIDLALRNRFHQCMYDKNYTIFIVRDCGKVGSTNFKCNM